MAWSNLTSTQFVSYTDAQTSGISTKLTLPTSNQWMTKTNLTTYLNVNTTNLASYGANQYVPKSSIVAGTSNVGVTFANAYDGTIVDNDELTYSEKMRINITNTTSGTLTFSIKSVCDPYNSGTRRFRMSKYINNTPTIIFTASVTAHYERTDSITINVGETLDILLYYYSLGGNWSADMSATIMSCTASSGQAVTIGAYPTFYVSAYYAV